MSLMTTTILAVLASSAALVAAQYESLEQRPTVAFQSKSGLGPLYSSFSAGSSQGFRDTSYEDNAVTPAPTPLYRPSAAGNSGQGGGQQVYRKPDNVRYQANQPSQRGKQPFGKAPLEGEPLEDEKEEPDRLTLLLPQSKFDCVGKQTGYYADEELNCEVFHYCQDNARHSWICPEGFTFHQVHLICMPPNGDISCKKSSQYHFVNEYLYKPLNLEEAESKPNVTLRYSERYFPSDIYTDERGETQHYHRVAPAPQRRPVYLSQPTPTINSIPVGGRPQPSPATQQQFRIPINQVFRSPEEINISLQQRRPPSGSSPTQQTYTKPRYPIRADEEYDRK